MSIGDKVVLPYAMQPLFVGDIIRCLQRRRRNTAVAATSAAAAAAALAVNDQTPVFSPPALCCCRLRSVQANYYCPSAATVATKSRMTSALGRPKVAQRYAVQKVRLFLFGSEIVTNCLRRSDRKCWSDYSGSLMTFRTAIRSHSVRFMHECSRAERKEQRRRSEAITVIFFFKFRLKECVSWNVRLFIYLLY